MDLADQMAAVWARRVLVLTAGLVVAVWVFAWRTAAPEVFESSATVQVQPPAPVTSDTATQVEFYADTVVGLATSRDVVAGALDALGRADDPTEVAEQIAAEAGSEPGFVMVTASDETAAAAMELVDAVVTAVVERVSADQSQESPVLSEAIADVDQLRDGLPRDAENIRARLERLSATLDAARQGLGGGWQVVTVAQAEAPDGPASPVPPRDALLALLVTVILVGEGIVVRRAWRRSLSARDPAGDVRNLLGVPVVELGPAAGPGALTPLLTSLAHAPRVTVIDRGRRPGAQTATLLAELLAARGREVLLVDAVPARPSVHHELGTSVSPGLGDLPSAGPALTELLDGLPRLASSGVRVLPAGGVDPTSLRRTSERLDLLATGEVCVVVAVSVAQSADVATVLGEGEAGAVVLAIEGEIPKPQLAEDAAALHGLGLELTAATVHVGASTLSKRRQARRSRGAELAQSPAGASG